MVVEEMLCVAHGGQRTGIPLVRGGLVALGRGRFGAGRVNRRAVVVRVRQRCSAVRSSAAPICVSLSTPSLLRYAMLQS